ncbi:MAG: hypothetical protein QM754_11895 [Tepidisphaeraceae bacterium]
MVTTLSYQPRALKRDIAEVMETWQLQRKRRIEPISNDTAVAIRQTIQASGIVSGRHFRTPHSVVRVRPIVASAIDLLWSLSGTACPVAEFCQAIYGRPASLRAVRQTAFRCSRVMERADCPLIISCRALMVFVEYRRRLFVPKPLLRA